MKTKNTILKVKNPKRHNMVSTSLGGKLDRELNVIMNAPLAYHISHYNTGQNYLT